uniref:VWC2L-like N-terminal domain-containing protein n=1 Tax=Xiphophorus couchianus TaxID=32473 RepID=A0A3B5LTM1_9TELE
MVKRALPGLSVALAALLLIPGRAADEYSTKTEPDYEFGDYRGKWCIDDHGFVYSIGEVYYPSPTACPCTCTVDGPVCVRPRCPRIHPQCTRIRYKACCPVCEAMARVCVYGGKTYRLLEEFRVRQNQTSPSLLSQKRRINFFYSERTQSSLKLI